MKKGSWERVSYPSVLQGKERGDGGHGHCIAVGGMIWNIKCRNEVGRMFPDTALLSKLRTTLASEG